MSHAVRSLALQGLRVLWSQFGPESQEFRRTRTLPRKWRSTSSTGGEGLALLGSGWGGFGMLAQVLEYRRFHERFPKAPTDRILTPRSLTSLTMGMFGSVDGGHWACDLAKVSLYEAPAISACPHRRRSYGDSCSSDQRVSRR